jgi:SAM-dependent methyltransferase
MTRSYVREYWEGKPLEGLRRAVTPDWSGANVERHLALLDPPPGAKHILEIGCGLGRLLIPLYDRGARHGVGVDASRDMLVQARQNIGSRRINWVHCDGQGMIPIRCAGYFDFAFSIITFQHIPDLAVVQTYLSEAYRLLASGGAFRFQVLAADIKPGRELWTYHDHMALAAALISLGFSQITQTAAGVWTVFGAVK